MALALIILSMEFNLTKMETFHFMLFILYLSIGIFLFITFPFFLIRRNHGEESLRQLFKSLVIFPFFYFLPIPLIILEAYLGINFVYGFYIYFGLSILLFILLRKRLIRWLF